MGHLAGHVIRILNFSLDTMGNSWKMFRWSQWRMEGIGEERKWRDQVDILWSSGREIRMASVGARVFTSAGMFVCRELFAVTLVLK